MCDPAAAAPSALTRHVSSVGGVAVAAESANGTDAGKASKQSPNKYAKSGG